MDEEGDWSDPVIFVMSPEGRNLAWFEITEEKTAKRIVRELNNLLRKLKSKKND